MAQFDAGTIEAVLRLRDEFTGVAKRAATQAQMLGSSFTQAGQRAQMAGAGLTAGLTLPIVAVGGSAVAASVDFSSAFTGVLKTVDDATDHLGALTETGERLRQGFQDMALEIPLSASELARVGEAAGQLGIASGAILGFTETIAKLGSTTNLSTEEAAFALAQLANITGLPQTEFDRLGSTIVALGNNLATTESQIVEYGRRLAAAGTAAALTEPQILAIGGAVASAGVTAELGGTNLSRALNLIATSVATSSDELVLLAETAGLSAEQFQQAWAEDASGTFLRFVEGLGGQGARMTLTLDDLGLGGQEVARVFQGLAGNSDRLTAALGLGETAWRENVALTHEATRAYAAPGAQFKLLWNEVTHLARQVGDGLVPALLEVATLARSTLLPMVQDMVTWFTNLSPPVRMAILIVGGLMAAIGPLLLVVGQMSIGLGMIVPLLGSLGSGLAMLMSPWASFMAALGKAGAVLAPVKALLLAVGGVFMSLTAPVMVVVGAIGLVVAAFAALLVGTEQGRAVLAATGRFIKEGLIWVFNELRDILAWTGEAVIWLGEQFTKMVPQFVLDSLDWVAKAIGGVADAIGRTNAAAAATDHLARLNQEMLDLGTSTGLTKEAMDRIARQAIELRDKGQTLTVGLARIVDHFQKTTLASEQLQATLDAVAGVTSIADLSNMTRRLAESGQASSEVMQVIADRARALHTDGSDLTEVLQRVVNAYGEAATAGEAFGENTGGATPHVQALAEDVQALVDTWTGASLKSNDLIAAFETLTAEQLGNERVMTQVMEAYASMRTVLGPFHAELERLWQTHERLKTPLASNTDLTERLMQAQIAATQAQAALNERLEAHRRALLNLPTDQAITAFEELRTAWADIIEQGPVSEETMNRYAAALQDAAAAGHELTAEEVALVEATAEAVKTTSQYEVALASLAGQLGAAAGQSLNLAISMLEANKNLKEGDQGFSDIRIGAAKASAVFHTLGDAIGGTAGKILSEVGNIAQAFASGGLIGGIIAGVGAAIKGLKSLFGGASEAELAGRETAAAFRDGVIATLTDGQLAEATEAALGAWRGNEQGAQFLIGVRDAYVSVGHSAAEAEAMVTRLWEAEARGPEAVAAVQREMQVVLDQAADLRAQFEQIAQLQTFDSATDQLQQLTSAAAFFGVEADEMGERLGNAFKAVEQAASAEDIAQHFHTLLASGVDLGTALDLAKDKVQGVITASLQMGTEIPAAMQPIAAQLIAQGQLLDDSEKQITDINQLEFAPTMTDGIEILVLSMNQLITTMGGEVPAAAQQFADGVSQSATEAAASVDQQLIAQLKKTIETMGGEVPEAAKQLEKGVGEGVNAAADIVNNELIAQLMKTIHTMSGDVPAAAQRLAAGVGRSATDAAASVDQQLLAQIDNVGLAVHDLSVEELVQMATAFEATAHEAGLSLEDELGEALDTLKTGLASTTRDELPDLVRAFQQTATDAVQALDRIPRTLTFDHHTRYSSSGSRGEFDGDAPGFQGGTHGRFVDFGAGTSVVLHGRERVVTEAEGRRDAADLSGLRREFAGLHAELRGVREDLQRLPEGMFRLGKAGALLKV